MGAVNGNGESRRTGQGTGYQSHDTGSIDVEGIFQSYCRQGGGADDEQGDDDKRLALAPEGVEKSGPAYITPSIPINTGRIRISGSKNKICRVREVSEQQGNEDDGGDVERKPFNLDSSQHEA